ncbi:hypothetical protein E2320_006367, partial [Naja naja]
MAEVREQVGDRPLYISFDIDALDPAFAPGTGTPRWRVSPGPDPHPMALGGGPAGLALSSFQLPRRLWRSSEAAKGCTSWGDLVEVAPCTICP